MLVTHSASRYPACLFRAHVKGVKRTDSAAQAGDRNPLPDIVGNLKCRGLRMDRAIHAGLSSDLGSRAGRSKYAARLEIRFRTDRMALLRMRLVLRLNLVGSGPNCHHRNRADCPQRKQSGGIPPESSGGKVGRGRLRNPLHGTCSRRGL